MTKSPRIGFVNHSNYSGPKGEVFTQPSKTVPDMHMSLREMLDRHLHGSTVKTYGVTNVPVDSMIPINLDRMSAIDRADLSKQVSDFVATTRGRLQSAKQARKQAEFDALVSAEAAKRLAVNLKLADS